MPRVSRRSALGPSHWFIEAIGVADMCASVLGVTYPIKLSASVLSDWNPGRLHIPLVSKSKSAKNPDGHE